MKLTKDLKQYAIKTYSLPADANESLIRKTFGEKIADGTLEAAKLVEISKTGTKDSLVKLIDDRFKVLANNMDSTEGTGTVTKTINALSTDDVFGGGSDERQSNPRVKSVGEAFYKMNRTPATTKSDAKRYYKGHAVERPSEFELAKLGVFFKCCAIDKPALNEHERALRAELWESDWCGDVGGDYYERIKGSRTKDLLNDSISGGQYAAPYEVDEAIIAGQLLYSELAPYVTTIDISRGSTLGAAIGIPSVTWGPSEGTAVTPFDTAGLISPFNCTVYPVQAALSIGRDFFNDTPFNIGEQLFDLLSQRGGAELDRVIAIGDGITQPQGLFNKTGATIINSALGSGGPFVVADAETLQFDGIPKQYRKLGNNCSFVGNDKTYRRLRTIPWGDDIAMRVMGMDESDYEILGWPYRVQNDIPDGYLAACALKYYRLYRRQGLESRMITEGQTLAIKNENLLMVRARYAGGFTLPAALAVMPDGPIADG